MTSAAKRKVSLTLSSDLVALVDRNARRSHETRSGVIEKWLRSAARAATAETIDDATAAYYRAVSDDERQESEAIARASSRAARRVSRGTR